MAEQKHEEIDSTSSLGPSAQPLSIVSPEEERVEQFCLHLARIIRETADPSSLGMPAPDSIIVVGEKL